MCNAKDGKNFWSHDNHHTNCVPRFGNFSQTGCWLGAGLITIYKWGTIHMSGYQRFWQFAGFHWSLAVWGCWCSNNVIFCISVIMYLDMWGISFAGYDILGVLSISNFSIDFSRICIMLHFILLLYGDINYMPQHRGLFIHIDTLRISS